MFEITEEMKQAAQQAKKDKIAYAKEHLDLDWGDDEKHWRELAKKFEFRLPVFYQPNTETKYIKKLFRKVGVDIQLYLADCGITTLKRLNAMNPQEPAFVSIGFAMEWLDEYFQENRDV